MLMDIYTGFGMNAIGQVDLVERQHRNQSIPALGRMAFQVIQAVLIRLQEQGKLEIREDFNTEMTQVGNKGSEYLLEKKVRPVEERPPMVEV